MNNLTKTTEKETSPNYEYSLFMRLLRDILNIDISKLIAKRRLGELSFSSIEIEINSTIELMKTVNNLLVARLPDEILNEIYKITTGIYNVFKEMLLFNVNINNPQQHRDLLIEEFLELSRDFYQKTHSHAAYYNNEYNAEYVSRQVKDAVESLKEDRNKINSYVKDSKIAKDELYEIVNSAREVATSAGIGVFTEDFKIEANLQSKKAKTWLITTIILAFLTLTIASISFFTLLFITPDSVKYIQLLTSKVAIILILLTATLWCGRIYKATLHLAYVNKHRANALQTFLAFSHATTDPQTKNAVLLEATHCIFGITNTGLVESGDSNEHIKLMEIFKTVKTGS